VQLSRQPGDGIFFLSMAAVGSGLQDVGVHGARVGGVGEAKVEGGGPGEGPGGCLQVEVALLASQEGH